MSGMIFIRRESLRDYIRLFPVTSLILAVQIVMFIVVAASGGLTDPENVLLRYGALYHIGEDYAAPWRYVASIVLHNGFQHLLFNSFALYVFAAPLERMLGHMRYLLLYAVSGVAGNLVSQWLSPEPYIAVGASGAIFGVYAAYLFIGLFRKQLLDRDSSRIVLITLAVGIVYSFVTPHINWYAHFGGMVGGFLTALFYSPWLRPVQHR